MFGCSSVCPRCRHEFTCCSPATCCNVRRSLHGLSGGSLVSTALAPQPAAAILPPLPISPSCQSPQVSPSVALSFIMPPFAAALQPAVPPLEAKPETELKKLSDTVKVLRQSGWYYEGISYQQSHELLKEASVGTFLVRNSSDPRFLFSLSVQTERGPTSVRIFYINGYFRLDAQAHLQAAMPMFPSVIELVLHYIEQSNLCRTSTQVWVDSQGKWYSSILLKKPLLQKPPSLKHLARLEIHKTLAKTRPRVCLLPAPHSELELPKPLKAYLAEYPYSI